MAWWLTRPKSDWEPVGYNKKRTTQKWLHHYKQADWGYNFYMVQRGEITKTCENLVESMTTRIRQVIKNKGSHINY